MGLVTVTPPAVEPLTLEEAKRHARIYHDADDVDVARYIKAGRKWLERFTRRAFVQQVLRATFRDFPREDHPAVLALPRPPLVSVSLVQYKAAAGGVLTTLDAAGYQVDPTGLVGTLEPAYGAAWPGVRVGPQAVQVTYTAGYGALGTDVEEDLREALCLLVTHQTENRAALAAGTAAALLPFGVRTFAYHHRVLTFPRQTPKE